MSFGIAGENLFMNSGRQFSMWLLFLHMLWVETLICLCSVHPLFWDVGRQTASEDRDQNPLDKADLFIIWYNNNFSQWGKGRACWLPIIKDSGFLSLGFLSCGAHPLEPLCVIMWDMWNKRNWCRQDTCAVSNKVVCFWSRSLLSSASIYETVAGQFVSL